MLSALVVRALVADQGYLWVATPKGVRRYDGYQAVPLSQLLLPGARAAPTATSTPWRATRPAASG